MTASLSQEVQNIAVLKGLFLPLSIAASRCIQWTRTPSEWPRAYPTTHHHTGQREWPTTETEYRCCKSRNMNYYTNQNINIATQRTSTK